MCLLAIVANITEEVTVRVVHLHMNVINVIKTIQAPSVIFVPQDPSPPAKPSLALPTPVRINRLAPLLSGYSTSAAEYLINGFCFGFPIPFQGPSFSTASPNLLSAEQHPGVLDHHLTKELLAQRVAGPFTHLPFQNFRVSPIGVVPKKTPGEFHCIQHLSYPYGASVNDGIPVEDTSVNYSRIDDAVGLILRSGVGSCLAKTDIKSAFRIIPIRPADYHLLAIYWRGNYYFDRCLPMGLTSSCKTFEALSTAVQWIAQTKLRISHMLHLLDDFLIISGSHEQCSRELALFLELCSYLGIPMAPDKTVGPSTVLSFAGIELDTVHSEARLPLDKVMRCASLLSDYLKRKKVTLRELQSLIGLLNFPCSVVLPGRAFLRRLIDLTIGITRPQHFIRLTRAVKSDMRTWLAFLSNFNGSSFFLNQNWITNPSLQLYTDASGSFGYGAVFRDQWFYGPWPDSWKSFDIAALEFYPIVLSVIIWGPLMRNQRITFFTDNEALVHITNKNSCRDKFLMSFVRRLVLVCLQNNILFRARHVPGIKNDLADSLSRLQLQRFRRLAPTHMQPSPVPIPTALQPEHWQMW